LSFHSVAFSRVKDARRNAAFESVVHCCRIFKITPCHNVLYTNFHCHLYANLKFHRRCCWLSYGDSKIVCVNNNEKLIVVVQTGATAQLDSPATYRWNARVEYMEANIEEWKNQNMNFNSKKLSFKAAFICTWSLQAFEFTWTNLILCILTRSSLFSWKITANSSTCTLHNLNHKATNIIQ
jgi:hypothetical protein